MSVLPTSVAATGAGDNQAINMSAVLPRANAYLFTGGSMVLSGVTAAANVGSGWASPNLRITPNPALWQVDQVQTLTRGFGVGDFGFASATWSDDVVPGAIRCDTTGSFGVDVYNTTANDVEVYVGLYLRFLVYDIEQSLNVDFNASVHVHN